MKDLTEPCTLHGNPYKRGRGKKWYLGGNKLHLKSKTASQKEIPIFRHVTISSSFCFLDK